MFLSTENPPHDPLSSSSPATSSLLHLTTSSHELGQSHLQNFSIRDYAYSNRKNSIKNSWPFSPKSLQICSTHGVTDPLPPFETTASSSSGKQIVSHVHRGTGLAKLGLKGGCSQSRVIKNGFGTSTSVSKSKVEIVVAGTSNNNKNSKKCGRGGGGMVKSKEDTCGGGLVMTTTCPICKTFSSASNTTLNAHIDQCLSADSELPPVSTYKPNKHRVDQRLSVDSAVPPVSSTKPNKPRVNQCLSVDLSVPPVSTKPNKPRAKPQMKVKTMVDIYASAKRCTLEDLDKRNGTTWVSILSHTNRVVADKVSKKRKASPVGVGPVYIDAKGQKLRILTEFSEKKTCTTTTLREQHEGGSSEKKSSSQGSKENSKSLRKRRLGKKHYKYLKLTNLKANNTSEQVPDYQRVFCGEGSSKGHRRIYNQRMLSKPGLVSKRLNEKGHKLYDLRDQPSEDDDDSWSGGERLVLRGTDSSPLKKQKEVSGRNKAMFGSKGAQSRSFRVQMSEKEEASLAVAHLDTLQVKKRLASIQENKYPLGKNVSEVSPRATSMRKVSPQFVANGWRRLSLPVELKKARLDSSEEEEAGKWESEMTQERELSDDDYVSGYDDTPSFDDDDDEESSDEEDEDNSNNNNSRANVLDKSNDATPSERAMYYYSEEVEEMIYRQTTCDEDVRFESEVRGKGSLFVEVDTIPIPGPPGSFLPSPRDMCYDENLGNSSVITSQFHSFDRNSSESPVSAVSNVAPGKLSFPVELSSSYTTTPISFCVPSHHETITEAELMTVGKTEPPPRLRSNDHESCCCCQRKERISEGIALNHQTSHLLQRRGASYSSHLDTTNHPFEESPYMIQQDLELQSKFSSRAVVVPPSPNPVLRLMGKDLMVMNQGEADKVEASRDSLKPPTQFLDSLHCPAGTGLYFNTGLYLRNSFESTHHQPQTPQAQAQTQTQASPFRHSFDDHVRYFSPS
ncbi:uncharacterized protein LOC111198015 isoform X1 [Brassica napus]|uniref:uncharacterized protein LOC111198015 isoform X1 n=1 Tax=Brassica napus TaxID=3708 RepID=UPI0020787319|nr:uncharacterized protein LOC111198015 isoform X1 [Brassica napus]XP_022569907.2 uncharacterized protein LOC111198015 isoform X1 [Brassica napus]